eukprot:TRINITY_DN6498_c0_g1_i1.p1 TRINITY_DN6498_c0_g1~~TRINITY_DN6498_c0_g1_i1.p1  ORF type:complete len:738 (+),score=299.81 TRINITY_DN6498_c0_g1_i1:218-2215(+)
MSEKIENVNEKIRIAMDFNIKFSSSQSIQSLIIDHIIKHHDFSSSSIGIPIEILHSSLESLSEEIKEEGRESIQYSLFLFKFSSSFLLNELKSNSHRLPVQNQSKLKEMKKISLFYHSNERGNADEKDFPSKCAFSNWIGSGRYAVVDLNSLSTQHGSYGEEEGSFNSEHWNGRGEDTLSSSIQFHSQISQLILSSVNHVFVPDLKKRKNPSVEKLLIPIVRFRNYNPNEIEESRESEIDLDLIRREINSLALPNQQILFTVFSHSLFEHHHVSLAVSKCTKQSSYFVEKGDKLSKKFKGFLDSTCLLHHLKEDTHDILTSGLISRGEDDSTLSSFFNPNLPSYHSNDNGKNVKNKGSQGTKILPIYVFSLQSNDTQFLLDEDRLYASAANAGIVLQTGSHSYLRNEYCTKVNEYESKAISIYPQRVNRNIIAAITSSFGGILDPSLRFSPIKRRLVKDYTWSFGNQPFNSFTGNQTRVSQIFADHIKRNVILNRLQYTFQSMDNIESKIVEFVDKYISNPFDTSHHHEQTGRNWREWIDVLYKDSKERETSMSTLAISIVHQIDIQLKRVDRLINSISNSMSEYKLIESISLSSSLEFTIKGLEEFIHHRLEEAEVSLLCCYLETKATFGISYFNALLPTMFALAFIGGGVVWGITKRKKQKMG